MQLYKTVRMSRVVNTPREVNASIAHSVVLSFWLVEKFHRLCRRGFYVQQLLLYDRASILSTMDTEHHAQTLTR